MQQQNDYTTKQKILYASIDLFAENGFRDISVRQIAKAVGIKASSLYKHYENKEDILESIFSLFKEKIEQTEFPAQELMQYIDSGSPLKYLNDAFALFKQVMWEPLILKVAKIITIEQQRNGSVREFFKHELIKKPNQILQAVFNLMVDNGTIDATDTQVLAEEYNSYIVYLYFEQNFLGDGPDLDEIEKKMKQHNAFYANHILKKSEETLK